MGQIVCIASERWQQTPTRTQRLLPLLPDMEILYFEPAISHFSFGQQKLRRGRDGTLVEQNGAQVLLYTLPCSIAHTEDYVAFAPMQFSRMASFIRRAMAQNGFDDPILWCCIPECGGLLEEIPHSSLIYDCCKQWNTPPLSDWEHALCDEADITFAASLPLVQHLRPLCHNVSLLPNGCDLSPYESAFRGQLRTPADLSELSAPVIGILGDCSPSVQLDPVIYAAKNLPSCSFVIAGALSPYHKRYRDFTSLPNCHVLGPKSSVSLPHYLRHFQVCLELFDTEQPEQVLEERFYSYLYSGAPIIMLGGECPPQFADVVYPAQFDIDFLDACRRALSEEGDLLRKKRREYALQCQWSQRQQDCDRILHASALI
jgi:hypothetical protein